MRTATGIGILLTFVMPLAALAEGGISVTTNAEARASGSSDASAEVHSVTSGGGTSRVEITTEVDGVRRTEVREQRVPTGRSVIINVSTSTKNVATDSKVRVEASARATSSVALPPGALRAWAEKFRTFLRSLFRFSY